MTAAEAEWDHEIAWVETLTHTVTDRLPWGLDVRDTKADGALVRVASVRPVDEGHWVAFETGDCSLTKADISEDGPVEVRIGWGPVGCIERLPEFEGW